MKFCTKCGCSLEFSKNEEPIGFDGYTGKPKFLTYLICPNYTTPEFWHIGIEYGDGSLQHTDDNGHIQITRIEK